MVLKCRCCLLPFLQLFERLYEHDRLAESYEEVEVDIPLQTQPGGLAGQCYLRYCPWQPLCCMKLLLLLSEEWSVSVSEIIASLSRRQPHAKHD